MRAAGTDAVARACRGYPSLRNATVIIVRPTTEATVLLIKHLLTDHCHTLLIRPDQIRLSQNASILVATAFVPKWRQALPLHAYSPVATNVSNPSYARRRWRPPLPVARPRKRQAIVDVNSTMYTRYFGVDEWAEKWRSLLTEYAPNVTLRWIGRTYENRSLCVLTVGKTSMSNPRRLLLNALQHAREIATTPIATYVVERLANALALGIQPYASLLTRVEVVVVPMVNPDGYAQVRAGEVLWRKNVRPKMTASSCVGVDLNRNWGFQFGSDNNGLSDPCEDNYTGPAPFSEPETQALRQLVLETDGILAHLDIHSFGQLVLGPWSYGTTPPRDCARVNRVGLAIAQDITAVNQNRVYRYSVAYRNNLLYTASGTMADWMFARGVMSFTIEVRPAINENDDVFTSFQLPRDEILPACRENFAAIQRLLLFVYNDSLPVVAEEQHFPQPNSPSGGNCTLPLSDEDEDLRSDSNHTLPVYIVAVISAASAVVVVSIIVIVITVVLVRRNRN